MQFSCRNDDYTQVGCMCKLFRPDSRSRRPPRPRAAMREASPAPPVCKTPDQALRQRLGSRRHDRDRRQRGPAGDRADLGELSTKAGDGIATKLEVPLGPELDELPVTQVLGLEPLPLTLPDGGSVSVQLQKVKVIGATTSLEAVSEGKPFPMREDPRGSRDLLRGVPGGRAEGHHRRRRADLRSHRPRGDQGGAGRAPADKGCEASSGNEAQLLLEDWEVTVYERTTATEVAKKTFEAKKEAAVGSSELGRRGAPRGAHWTMAGRRSDTPAVARPGPPRHYSSRCSRPRSSPRSSRLWPPPRRRDHRPPSRCGSSGARAPGARAPRR